MKKRLSAFLLVAVLACTVLGVTVHANEWDELTYIAAKGLSVSGDTLYITDSYTNQIYSYDGETLTLLAGNSNWIDGIPTPGYLDGVAEYALFDEPSMAVSWNGGVIVSDTQNNVLRFIKDGVVTTYAGTGQAGYTDGDVSASAFYLPTGLAVGDDGTLYVADAGNGVIRAITTAGVVSTYADDFCAPSGLYWYEGVLYVTDVEANVVLSVQDGVVSLVAGVAISLEEEMVAGYQDGAADQALFSLPQGIYVDEKGIYVADVGNDVVRKIASGDVTTVYTSELISDPISIVSYQGTLLVGDNLVRNIFGFTDDSDTLLQPVQDVQSEAQSTEQTESQSISNDSAVNVVLIVLASLVVVGLVGAVVVLQRKKKTSAGQATPEETTNELE